MAALAKVLCILFGIVDTISLIWFAEKMSLSLVLAQLVLILAELSPGLPIEIGKAKIQHLAGILGIYVIGAFLTIFYIYQSTTYIYGTDWFVFIVRTVLLLCFMVLSSRVYREIRNR